MRSSLPGTREVVGYCCVSCDADFPVAMLRRQVDIVAGDEKGSQESVMALDKISLC